MPTGDRTTDGSCDNSRHAPVAQLDRVLPSEGRGRGFESRRARQFLPTSRTKQSWVRQNRPERFWTTARSAASASEGRASGMMRAIPPGAPVSPDLSHEAVVGSTKSSVTILDDHEVGPERKRGASIRDDANSPAGRAIFPNRAPCPSSAQTCGPRDAADICA